LIEARKILSINQFKSMRGLIEKCNALWVYQGKPGEPHALLASGKHSNAYFNVNEATKYTNLNLIFAYNLFRLLHKQGIDKSEVDVVVSSSQAAVTFGEIVSLIMNSMFVYTEKDINGKQKWTGRFTIPEGANILQVEELITTIQTTVQVRDAVLSANPKINFVKIKGKNVVGTIVHRPDDLSIEYPEFEVIPLIPQEVHNWSPDECPLCKKGSIALPPKANWSQFVEKE
jgi:orotate phosphoribosyltransferase